jgi:hypothetical protein
MATSRLPRGVAIPFNSQRALKGLSARLDGIVETLIR